MAPTADEREVVVVGAASVRPRLHVVDLRADRLRRAAAHTLSIAFADETFEPFRDDARPASDANRLAVLALDNDLEIAVTDAALGDRRRYKRPVLEAGEPVHAVELVRVDVHN